MDTSIPAAAAVLLLLTTGAFAQSPPVPAPKPGAETPRADVSRTAPPGTLAGPAAPAGAELLHRLPAGTLAPPTAPRLVPGVTPGVTPKVQGSQPTTVRPLDPGAGPGAVGPVKPRPGTRGRATGDDDEMDDLDIQRRKLQGAPANRADAPVPRVRPGSESPRDTLSAKGN